MFLFFRSPHAGKHHHNHHRYHHHHRHHQHHHNDTSIYDYLPSSIDWRNEGAVNGVRNKRQGECGSCWAFSTTGAIEGQHFRKTGKLVSLSEQNLVDCTDNCSCEDGCSLNEAYSHVMNNGIDTTDEYPTPYSEAGGVCKFVNSSNVIKITGFKMIIASNSKGHEYELQEAIATIGPISVEMDASHSSFQHYHGGIYYEPKCKSSGLDHGVLAVGYGTTEKGEHYYIVKNWWGEDWGDRGYFKIVRNRNNHCGIASVVVYPIV